MNLPKNLFHTVKRPLFGVAILLLFCSAGHSQLSVDNASRENSRVFYNSIYPASENVAIGWTGNLGNGNAGTTTTAFKDAIFLRVNFFRALAGIPAAITNNSDWSSQAQSAALMMAANQALDHTPPTSWKYYSAGGAYAAGKSNIALSYVGLSAISSYMEDPGANNEATGHRRWLLYPQTQEMGTGDIPAVSSYLSSNALWVVDTNHFADERPEVRDEFVAWPPAGYVPYSLIFPRWSFSYPGANFLTATVSMSRNGVNLPVRIESREQGFGENTIVFVPENLNPNSWSGPVKPASDTTTTVTVSNVQVGLEFESFSYNVTSFDPAQSGVDTPSFAIEGSATPQAGTNNTYSVAPQVMASGYQWKYSTKAPYTVVTSAEIAGEVTSSGFSARDSKTKSVGKYSYHLAHPNFVKSSFTIKDSLICSPTSSVTFASRLTYSTNNETARVEVSTDGGNLWQSIWSQAGKNNPGEKAFATRRVSLSAFAGKEIKVRFNYDYKGSGTAYTQTNLGVGWYVDAVTFAGVDKLTGTVTSGVSSTPNFMLNPQAGKSYSLQVRAETFGKYFLGWSPVKTVIGR